VDQTCAAARNPTANTKRSVSQICLAPYQCRRRGGFWTTSDFFFQFCLQSASSPLQRLDPLLLLLELSGSASA
jgi:hypothetical protein